ncbi:DNA-binding PadR family transcriptional regulator [Mycolicibacterium iranicum]|uniref:DNA-binding PadR family transcriptional regulator n=1 Tax=Mycolicibacterium iranicum TaxID=912594 RepID=A0A839PZC8_MYCIR|nr:helix-turn-helix transcriptional regulator [Mycolicibacterium iranicum]MBB2988847.1 DNA-binding PadR family transcriptional regulator [Mycolicibacterium iranicum]
MTVRLLVLGVVRSHGDVHGYAVHRELMSWRVDTWTAVKPPSIYHAVKQLAREGKLAATEPTASPQGPNRVSYRLTADGERDFFRLLEDALRSPDIEEFGAGVAFMQCLPRARVQELLTEQLTTTRQIDIDLDAMKPQWPDPSAPPHAQHLLDLWRGLFRSNASWTSQMLERVGAGEFRFADE